MRCSSCSEVVKPVVAIDVDGTLAQYHRTLMGVAEDYLGIKFPIEKYEWDGFGEFSDHLELSKHAYRDVKMALRSGGFKRWMPQFNGVRILSDSLRASGAEVWITTTRPWMRMDNVDNDTREWLRRQGFHYHRLMFDDDKYGVLTELVDPERIVMVLDDEWEQVRRCNELGLPVVHSRTNFNTGVTAEFQVTNLAEAARMAQERIGFRDALQR